MIYGDYLCNLCINIMEEMSRMSGISYGTINILLFVVFGPLSTLIFIINSFIQLIFKNKFKLVNIILCIIGLILVLMIILPVLYVFLFGKF